MGVGDAQGDVEDRRSVLHKTVRGASELRQWLVL